MPESWYNTPFFWLLTRTRAPHRSGGYADLLRRHGIAFSVGVYPWPDQMQYDAVESRQVKIWRAWCEQNGCRAFIKHFPNFFVERAAAIGATCSTSPAMLISAPGDIA